MPNSSRLIRPGSMSARKVGFGAAASTSSLTNRSNSRRRASARCSIVGVAAHPQQQRHVRQFGDQHLDAAANQVLQPVDGAARRTAPVRR